MQERTLNSVVRALAASHVDRALRILSLLKTLGLQATRHTTLVLVSACAKASRSVESAALYWCKSLPFAICGAYHVTLRHNAGCHAMT